MSIEKKIRTALERSSTDLEDPTQHVWRQPHPDEPREEGGVCIKCGAFANAEGMVPCNQFAETLR